LKKSGFSEGQNLTIETVRSDQDPQKLFAATADLVRSGLDAARAHGAHIHVDTEDRRLRDLTLRIFMELADEAEFRTSATSGSCSRRT